MLIDVKYTRGWQLGLKKNLQDSVVKPIIFTTQKMNFAIAKKQFVQVNGQKTTAKNKIA